MSYSGRKFGHEHDGTWDPKKKEHTCCHSKYGSYHRYSCTAELIPASEGMRRPNKAESPEMEKVRELKRVEHLNSAQVAERMQMPLSKINKLYAQA